jgi:hypothetical protein
VYRDVKHCPGSECSAPKWESASMVRTRRCPQRSGLVAGSNATINAPAGALPVETVVKGA